MMQETELFMRHRENALEERFQGRGCGWGAINYGKSDDTRTGTRGHRWSFVEPTGPPKIMFLRTPGRHG